MSFFSLPPPPTLISTPPSSSIFLPSPLECLWLLLAIRSGRQDVEALRKRTRGRLMRNMGYNFYLFYLCYFIFPLHKYVIHHLHSLFLFFLNRKSLYPLKSPALSPVISLQSFSIPRSLYEIKVSKIFRILYALLCMALPAFVSPPRWKKKRRGYFYVFTLYVPSAI